MKTTKPKKKNPSDLTLRNLRAMKKLLEEYETRYDRRLDIVWQIIENHGDRIFTLEDKVLSKKGKKK